MPQTVLRMQENFGGGYDGTLMPSGARLFAEALASLNPCPVFTLVGDHLNGVLAELAGLGVPIIDMRHESAVAHAADAYARLSRRPALALVTGGPGHTNALTGLATAHLACSPLVLVSGSRSRAVADRGGFQDLDQTAMARPACKWAAEVAAPAQIPFYLRRAFEVAQAGRPGPVHLTVPVDVFETAADGPPAISQTQVSPVTPIGPELERAIELLRSSRRPVAIAGSGVWWSDAGQHLGAFIEKTGIALYTMNMARGVIPDNHPQCFGFADPALNRAAHSAYQEADLFLILGKRLDYRLALGSTRVIPAGAKCIQVDIDAGEFGINRHIDVALHADVKQTLATLTASLASSAMPEWTARQNELRDQWRARLSAAEQDRSSPLHPAVVFGELATALPMGALISGDGGDFTHWGRAIVPALQPG
ncbi:MAG TPA: thiamine pyrophosphate-binding protein, partial [Bryobacteraceae bacterium]|nr:thiamine pyrophosphate-binding protein [Bryobacteraceae bacterium]